MKQWLRNNEGLIILAIICTAVTLSLLLPGGPSKTYSTCEECVQAQCQECTDLCGSQE